MPQYLADDAEIAAFGAVARKRAARFQDLVLLHERAESIDRFGRRRTTASGQRTTGRCWTGTAGCSSARSTDRLAGLLRRRPDIPVMRSEPEAVQHTYDLLLAALAETGSQLSPG